MLQRFIYLLFVMLGIIAYLVSLFSPLLTISELYIFSNTLTIYSMMETLVSSGEWLLFIAIFIFALVLPSLKYLLLLIYGIYLNSLTPSSKIITILEAVSKWAMLDVFIIALLISSIKLKSLASAQTHYGIYLFVTAVLIAMLCSFLYKRIHASKSDA